MRTYGESKRLTKFPERHAPVLDPLVAILGVLATRSWAWVTCDVCGCLCRDDEVCPGCRSRYLDAAEALVLAADPAA